MPAPKPTLFIQLFHTGVFADGRPNTGPVQITDLDVGGENQNRKVPVYVPVGGSIIIPASSRSMLSFQQGCIAKFAQVGVIRAKMFYQPEQFTTVGRPAPGEYPAGTFIWNTTDKAPNWSDGSSWIGLSGPVGGDLTGSLPNPTVVGIQGFAIEALAPANGDALLFNTVTNRWEHSPIVFGGGPPVGPAGGSLAGLYPNPSIAAGAITDTEVAAANKDGLAATPSMRTLGAGAQQACAGNDARLSNARTPLPHEASHATGGPDALTVNAATATNNSLTRIVHETFTNLQNDGTIFASLNNQAASVGPSLQVGHPRVLDVDFPAGWNAGSVTVNGTDIQGNALSDTYAFPVGGGIVTGTHVYATITSVVNNTPAVAGNFTATVEASSEIGCSNAPITAFLKVCINGPADSFAVTSLAQGWFDTVGNHSGGKIIDVWYKQTITITQNSHTHTLT